MQDHAATIEWQREGCGLINTHAAFQQQGRGTSTTFSKRPQESWDRRCLA